MIDANDRPLLQDHPYAVWQEGVTLRKQLLKALSAAGVLSILGGLVGLSGSDQFVWVILIGGGAIVGSNRLLARVEQNQPSLKAPLSVRDQIQLDNWIMAKGGPDAAQFVGYQFGQATYENVQLRIDTVVLGVAEDRFRAPSKS